MHILSALYPFGFWRRQTMSDKALGWSSLTATIVCSSTAVVFGKQLAGVLSPLSLLFVSEGLTFLFTILSFGFVPLVRELLKQKRSALIAIFCISLSNSVIAPLLAFKGLQTTSAVNSALLLQTDLLFMAILAAVLLGERMERTHWIAAGSIIGGVVIVSMRGFGEPFVLHPGDILLLLAAASYSIGSITYKKYLHHIQPELMLFCRTCTAMIVFFGISPFKQHTLMQELDVFPAAMLVALLGYAFISRFLHLFTFYEALDRLPVRTISLLYPTGIVCSILFAYVYLHEPMRWYHALGGGLILMGVFVLEIVTTIKDRNMQQTIKQQRHV